MAFNNASASSDNSQPNKPFLLAFELPSSKLRLVFSDGEHFQHKTIEAGNKEALDREILAAKKKFDLNDEVTLQSCYEAGRDGFWLHRYLEKIGIDNIVFDSCSIEVNRRAKTDRIDGNSLIRLLIRYHAGEKTVWSVVNVPSPEKEDLRQLHRELECLIRERTRLGNQIKALLVTH